MKARLPQGHALPQSAKGSRHLAYCAACPNLGDGCRNPGGFYRIGRRSQTGREKRVGARQIQKAFFCKRNAAWHTEVANLWPHPIESPAPGKPAAPAFQHAIRPALHLMQRRSSLNSLGSSGRPASIGFGNMCSKSAKNLGLSFHGFLTASVVQEKHGNLKKVAAATFSKFKALHRMQRRLL